MNKAQAVIKFLKDKGIRTIFGIPGGNNLPFYDELSGSGITHILARHEQAAGFEAMAYAKIKHQPGICLTTSGPGALNLLTALADAERDGIPLIALTGQVSQGLYGRESFQESNICEAVKPVVKRCWRITSSDNVLSIMEEAFQLAVSPRQGPVLIDIHKDVFTEEISVGERAKYEKIHNEGYKEDYTVIKYPLDSSAAELLASWPRQIKESAQPVIICGGGIMKSGSAEKLKSFAEKQKIPVISTLFGLGVLPADHTLNFSMAGMHGSIAANNVLHHADLFLVFGARLDDRFTGNLNKFYAGEQKILRIDNNAEAGSGSVCFDVQNALTFLENTIEIKERPLWLEYCKKQIENYYYKDPNTNSHPSFLLKQINSFLSKNIIITTDVGQHQMWSAQYLDIYKTYAFLTSGGMGTMGFGLPSAIGAAFADKSKRVICLSGDGSFLMNNQELVLLAEHKLNITVVLFENNSLGLVRQQQKLFYGKNIFGCDYDTAIDFKKLAQAFGIKAFALNNSSVNAFRLSLKEDGPSFWIYSHSKDDYVFPMMNKNGGLKEMLVHE